MRHADMQHPWTLMAAIYSIIAAILCTLYHAIFITYGFSDDYSLLHKMHFQDNPLQHFQWNGRPISGIIFISWQWVDSIEALKYIRIIGLLSIASILTALSIALHRQSVSKKAITAILLLVLSSPSVGIYMGWGALFFYGFTATLTFLLGRYGLTSTIHIRPFLVLCICHILALMTYQTLVSFYFLALLVALLFNREYRPDFKRLCFFFGSFALSAILYYLWYKSGQFPFSAQISPRANMTPSFYGALQWLGRAYEDFTFPLQGALLEHSSQSIFALIGTILALTGWGITLFQRRKQLYILPIILFSPVLMVLANILSGDPYIGFRSLFTATILSLFYMLIALRYLTSFKYGHHLRLIFTCGILTLNLYLSHQNFTQHIALLSHREYHSVQQQLLEHVENHNHTLIYRRPTLEPYHLKTEYGLLSTFHHWVPPTMISLITHQHFNDPDLITLHQFGAGDIIPDRIAHKNYPIITPLPLATHAPDSFKK